MGKKVENGLKQTEEEVIVFDALVLEQTLNESPVERQDPGNNTRAFRQ